MTTTDIVHKEPDLPAVVLEKVVMDGDYRDVSAADRLVLIKSICDGLGLNIATQPFQFITTPDGRVVPYANKDCAAQLRRNYQVSIEAIHTEMRDQLYVVVAKAKLPSGRLDCSLAVVDLQGLRGERLANTMMKAETKAKRRVTLSICGLGFLDETEVEQFRGNSFDPHKAAGAPPDDVPTIPADEEPSSPVSELVKAQERKAIKDRIDEIVEGDRIKSAQRKLMELLRVWSGLEPPEGKKRLTPDQRKELRRRMIVAFKASATPLPTPAMKPSETNTLYYAICDWIADSWLGGHSFDDREKQYKARCDDAP